MITVLVRDRLTRRLLHMLAGGVLERDDKTDRKISFGWREGLKEPEREGVKHRVNEAVSIGEREQLGGFFWVLRRIHGRESGVAVGEGELHEKRGRARSEGFWVGGRKEVSVKGAAYSAWESHGFFERKRKRER